MRPSSILLPGRQAATKRLHRLYVQQGHPQTATSPRSAKNEGWFFEAADDAVDKSLLWSDEL
jgi:hypothetical protein